MLLFHFTGEWEISVALPCSIINELLTNAYKYAFPEGRSGNIHITFSKLPGCYYLQVGDDGVGSEEAIKHRRDDALGIRLVEGLVRQIGV